MWNTHRVSQQLKVIAVSIGTTFEAIRCSIFYDNFIPHNQIEQIKTTTVSWPRSESLSGDHFHIGLLFLCVCVLRIALICTGGVDPSNQKQHRDDSVVAAVDDELQRKPSVILNTVILTMLFNNLHRTCLHAPVNDHHQMSPCSHILLFAIRKLLLLTVHSWFRESSPRDRQC